jgi:putative DNA methylase
LPKGHASLVDDPSSLLEEFPTEADQDRERQRLFRLIEELVKWDNSNNKQLLEAAHREILKSTNGNPPPVYDPFCGGGSIPLEAQRLGLEAIGSDLNPVAVLITKALIEIPPMFSGQPPVHPMQQGRLKGSGMWEGARGLAEDVRYYAQWMRDQAFERIGNLYPKVDLPKDKGGEAANVIAWLWARTIRCPNPACGGQMPLVRSFNLSTKPDKEAWIEPTVDPVSRSVSFEVKNGHGNVPEGTVSRRGARCLICGSAVPFDYIRSEGRAGRIGAQLLAIVAEGKRERLYVTPNGEHEQVAAVAIPKDAPDSDLPEQALGFRVQRYGLTKHRDLFTRRQLVALTTYSDLVAEARQLAIGDGASESYANGLATYLAMGVSRLSDICNSLCPWSTSTTQVVHLFGRQAIPMLWDYAEPNIFAEAAGDFGVSITNLAKALEAVPALGMGKAFQFDATSISAEKVLFSTDPPYYDNIGYADLSDFLYVWLRRSLAKTYPDLFSTLLVPKKQELVAAPERFEGSRMKAQQFFEEGFAAAFHRMRLGQHPSYPLTVFYAFKQAETDDDDDNGGQTIAASTGWETMLEGLMGADFQLTGTWPIRSERGTRMRSIDSNALASSIVLVCRPREESATITTRKDFLAAMKRELPNALRNLQKGNIAPVDLAQAAIGPGMAVFSRFKKVLESDGSPMRVRIALGLINQTLDEVLSEQEGEFDPDTRWALAWFEQHAFDDGLYGEAEVLATAKALSISMLDETKILHSRAGKVRLLRRDELAADWNPSADHRLTVWAVTQHLIRSLDKNGETATAILASKVGGLAETARDLAYRLYVLCERKGWAEEAGYYNSLVVYWPAIAPKTFALS